jgi:PhnB protein
MPPEGYTSVQPYLYYENAGAAIDWLVEAFGFTERMRMANDEGVVEHAELDVGDSVVMLGQPGPDYQSPKTRGGGTAGVHVYVDDVDAHFDRARNAGATIDTEPTDQPYGDRRYDAKDIEGHNWFFAQRIG